MANQEHLRILEQGVDVWNNWRLEHPEIQPDLRHLEVSSYPSTKKPRYNAIFINGSGRGVILDKPTVISSCRASLHKINFSNADLREADFTNIDLSMADLSGAWLTNASLNIAYLHKAKLSKAELLEADLYRSDFTEAILTNAILVKTGLQRANFCRAILEGADLENANLQETNFSEANLEGAQLGGANIRETNFDHAIMRSIVLCGKELQGTIFIESNLANADLSEADLSGADFKKADMQNVNLSNATMDLTTFGDVDLSTVRGLDTITHGGPSTIGIDTIYRSKGRIPEIFLRKAGIPEDFITYMHSLVAHPIEYYTCFISYSTRDQDFAERLYTDLQSKGIRCWFAPEDMRIGDKIEERINESIRLYDKLLLVLSEYSVTSEWVEFEVKAALKKECKKERTVLFPIRLDDHVMQSNTAWAADIRRTRHIGNFIHWKDHDAYQNGLKRLLRDLQPDRPPEGVRTVKTN
jgi:uncharacterized protein YjbI with pentapeptide repeats